VYSDNGTLMLGASVAQPEYAPMYAPMYAPPSVGPASFGPSSVPVSRECRESWSDDRGWVVPAPPSTRTGGLAARRKDRGMLVMVGTGSLALLAAFAAALMALSTDDRSAAAEPARTPMIELDVAPAAAAPVAPPVAELPVAPPAAIELAPAAPAAPAALVVTPAPFVTTASPSPRAALAPVKAPSAVRVAAPKVPAPVVVDAPRSGPRVVAIALSDAAPRAASPVPAASQKPKPAAKSDRAVLEDLLEQQLNR
jgi:hypothetical protein